MLNLMESNIPVLRMGIFTNNFNKKRNDKFVKFKANVILTSTSHIHLHNQFDEMIKTNKQKFGNKMLWSQTHSFF